MNPDLSIIINTYNRPSLLVRALKALRVQEGADAWSKEIIVIDDGSETSPEDLLRREGLLQDLRLEVANHQGPSEARNLGIRLAQGNHILFMGDDIIARPNLVAAHMRMLTGAGDQKVISLGHSQWDVKNISQPLYAYSQAHHFANVVPGKEVDFRYFYTANIALPRKAFEEAGVFDTSFTGASWGWEDTELGYRLKQSGWRIIYNFEAWGEHVHPPMTIRQMLERQVRIAVGGCRFYAKYPVPEIAEVAFLPGTLEAKCGPRWKREFGILMAAALEKIAPNSKLLETIYGRLVFSCRTEGVQEGRRLFPDVEI